MRKSDGAGRQNLQYHEDTLDLTKAVVWIFGAEVYPADQNYAKTGPDKSKYYRTNQRLGEIKVKLQGL